LLTQADAAALIEPHAQMIYQWHTKAYKQRRHAVASLPGQWADQDPATHGKWTNNLIIARAAEDDSDDQVQTNDGQARVVQLRHEDVTVAQLRFRRVDVHRPYADSPIVPFISTPMTKTARRWVGNHHLRNARQVSLLDADPSIVHTNLIIGRTEDPILGELGKLFVACFDGNALAWSYEIAAGGDAVGIHEGMPQAAPTPTTRVVSIRKKGDGGDGLEEPGS